jgi:ABC-type Mn2+/Zn2+ transport system permease subunit
VVAIAQGALGLYLALWLDVPPGPTVAVLGASAYLLCAVAVSTLRPAPVPA